MLESKRYSFGELNRILSESHEVAYDEKEEKKNNEKAVDDIMKACKEYDGGLKEETRTDNPQNVQDYNNTTLDVKFSAEPSKEYKDRVKAQVHGFPSADNEKNSKVEEDNESLGFDGNKEFYDQQQEKNKEVNGKETELKHAGLKSHSLPEKNFENDTLFKESKKMKRLHFKNTVFISEAQMLKKIPDEFKTDNNKFIMKDAEGTEYLVECKVDETFNFPKFTVKNRYNEQVVNEELARMKSLYDYKSSDHFNKTEYNTEKKTVNNLSEMISRVKTLEKEGIE